MSEWWRQQVGVGVQRCPVRARGYVAQLFTPTGRPVLGDGGDDAYLAFAGLRREWGFTVENDTEEM